MMRHFTLLLLLAAGLLGACHRHRTDSDHIMTRLEETLPIINSQPRHCDSLYAAWQQHTADSGTWHRIQVFRATTHNLQGDSMGAEREYDKVRQYVKRQPNDHALMGLLMNHCGVMYNRAANAPKSLHYFEAAVRHFERVPKRGYMLSAYLNLADAQSFTGDMAGSIASFNRLKLLADSLHVQQYDIATFIGLGTVYMQIENYVRAHHYFRLAQKELPQADEATRFDYYLRLGNCYYFEHKLHAAAQAFRQALPLAEALQYDNGMLACHTNLCEVHLMANDLANARRELRLADSLLQVMTRRAETYSIVTAGGVFYLQSLHTDLALAEGKPIRLDRLRQDTICPEAGITPRYLMLHYERLHKYAADRGDWRMALHFHMLATRYADTLRNERMTNRIAELSAQYRHDATLLKQRTALADYKQRETRLSLHLALMALCLVGMALIGTLIFHLYRRKQHRRLAQQREQTTALRMEVVRNRVSPHYIFNVLGTALPMLQRYPEMVAPLELLIDVIRGNLLASGQVAVRVADEMALVRRYVELHHLTHHNRPRVVWHIDHEVEKCERLVPAMSLQIPVENALKHAFPSPSDNDEISIEVKLDEHGTLLLRVTDNGVGYTTKPRPTSHRDTGTGLRLLQTTLEMLNQRNTAPASCSLQTLPPPQHGTCITLRLPESYKFPPTHELVST